MVKNSSIRFVHKIVERENFSLIEFFLKQGGVLMRMKLFDLLTDDNFATDSISTDAGILVTQNEDVVYYLYLEYEGFFMVYLNLFDEEVPFRNILSEGIALTLEKAMQIAIKNLNGILYGNTAMN